MDRQLKRAYYKMTFAVMLRLTGTAVLAFLWARSYTGLHDNMLRVHRGYFSAACIMGGMLLDSMLTVLWTKSKGIFRGHYIAFLLLGWIYNMIYQIDLFCVNGAGIGNILFLFTSLILLVPQLAPFFIYSDARKFIDAAEENPPGFTQQST